MKTGSRSAASAEVRAARLEVVSRLADDLAHEIKNPLNAVVINLAVLRTRVEKGQAGAALERAEVVESEVRRAHDLMDRVLRLVRPAEDEAVELPLEGVLADVLPLVSLQARLARVPLDVAEPGAGVRVRARPATLRAALLALLGDAVLAAPAGEGAAPLPVTIAAEGATVEVAVPLGRPGAAEATRVLAAAAGAALREPGPGEDVVTLVLPVASA